MAERKTRSENLNAINAKYEDANNSLANSWIANTNSMAQMSLKLREFNDALNKAATNTTLSISGLEMLSNDVLKAVQDNLTKSEDKLKKQTSTTQQFYNLEEEYQNKQLDLRYKHLNEQNKLIALQLQLQAAEIAGDQDKIKFLKEKQKEIAALNKKEREEAAKKAKESLSSDFGDLFTGGVDARQKLKKDLLASAGITKSEDGWTSVDTSILLDGAKELTTRIAEIGSYQKKWDTRLFGDWIDSYSSLATNVKDIVGASPFIKQTDLIKNIDKALDSGLAYNIEQRAFLETLSDGIATTFDAFDSTLLQIVRVQQDDSTAYRLGMEASLNKYLNGMFYNTEYLNGLSDSVTGALYEATSLLSSTESIGFEYQVQKWLGSLYSVGMSQEAISSIASSVGKLASGDVSGTDAGTGRLLVMAASRAGLDYSELLTKGIDSSQMNVLLQSMVTYLEEIANSNKVVQQQYANVFGLKTSDIIAATNLVGNINDITKAGAKYNSGTAMSNLSLMASTYGTRMSLTEMLGNSLDNFKYTMANGIAGNPALYALWQISNMLDEYMNGIPIPAIYAAGFGVDLETSVADLMKVGALSTSLLGGMGSIISSLAEAGSGTGALGMLGRVTALSAVQNLGKSVVRGSGLFATGNDTSISSYQGNSSGQDVYDSSMASADDQKNDLQVQNTDENQIDVEDVNNNINRLYDLFDSVISMGALRVTFDNDFIPHVNE